MSSFFRAFAPLREILLLAACAICSAALSSAAEPRVLLDGAKVECVATQPEIVTPIGMAFDAKGRLLVIESHTHERPADYKGPPADRLRMFADSDGDGKLDKWTTFAEGFEHGCNVVVREDGGVYLVTRNDLRLLEDADDDGVADKDTVLLHLDTESIYPHNGLSGVAYRPTENKIYVALAENFGAPYKLIGSDGKTLVGGSGVGTVFRCDLEGRSLERWATGFWNIFTMAATPAGDLFAVDNDPDSCPSSRLVHVMHGGDYGFRYAYGRSGLHPLQAWDGELPGTLPIVCGTGEAPTAMVVHGGYLWVTSWGDHRVERYLLTERGASFGADREVVVQGDADFRPTGMALAPDGSLYFADWVDKSYAVHGMGKIWRLDLPKDAAGGARSSSPDLTVGHPAPSARADDPFIVQQQIMVELESTDPPKLTIEGLSPRDALTRLAAARFRSRTEEFDAVPLLKQALASDDPGSRLYAVRWIADERIESLRDDVAKLLDADLPNERYYMGVLAALEWLDGDTTLRASTLSDGLLARELKSNHRSAKIHALALRLISPNDELLSVDRLRGYLSSDEPSLRLEAIRTLALQTNPDRFKALAEVVSDKHRDVNERAEAIVGLTLAVEENLPLLTQLAEGDEPILAREAQRVLRLSGKRPVATEDKPAADDLPAWEKLLGEGGDSESGRRLFFSAIGARCANCHVHGGRGGRIGPELTQIGRVQPRSRIIASILQPSREVAPQFQSWTLVTADGKSHAGLRLPKAGDDGLELYADPTGAQYTLPSADIELRELATTSIMPAGLEQTVSIADLRDLVAFLTQDAN